MSISAHFQQVSSRREGQRTKTRVSHSLTCCNEESIEVLGLQSGFGGDQRRPRLAHKAQSGTAVPSRAGTYTPSRTVWRYGTSSQCSSSWRMCVKPRSNFRVPVMTRAAAFRTRCSLSVVVLGAFASSAMISAACLNELSAIIEFSKDATALVGDELMNDERESHWSKSCKHR